MTLIQFIKYKLTEDSVIGDLANDIKGCLSFPSDKTEKEMMSFLEFKTTWAGSEEVFKLFKKEYREMPKSNKSKRIKIIEKPLLRSEIWRYYKQTFSIDKVHLICFEDIYKIYCVNTKTKKALTFNLESHTDLNDISVYEEEDLYVDELNQITSVSEAISILNQGNHDSKEKLFKYKINEIVDFLERNNKN